MAAAGAVKGKTPDIGIKVSIGSGKSESQSSENQTTQRGSSVQAGGTAAFVATNGDVTVAGSNVNANDVVLAAKNQVNIVNTTDTDSTRSSNSSSSSSVGVQYKASGMTCGFTTGWQGWIQIENYSAWQGAPIATRNNGFDGTDAQLEINKPLQVAHIAFLQNMVKQGTFTYVGRKDEATAKFYSGDCGIMMGSSGALANVQKYAKFQYGTGMMPYDPSVKGAPQNAIIGGASLWVLAGKKPEVYKGVAQFLAYLASPAVAAKWHQDTGYLPVTTAAYDLTRKQGFYDRHPGADTATRQMLNKPPLPYTKGLRLGNMPQIRTVVDEELEQVWIGTKTPQQALDSANSRGNELLRRFEQQGG